MFSKKRLIIFLLSDYGKALFLIILPILVIFPPLHENKKGYVTCLVIIIIFDIILMVTKKKIHDDLFNFLSYIFPSAGIAFALTEIYWGWMGWITTVGMLILADLLEAAALKPAQD